MTLVLSTSKAQLLLMLLFAHKLRSCWCLHTNLTLLNIFLFFTPPPSQEFSGGNASVPRSSALKGLNSIIPASLPDCEDKKIVSIVKLYELIFERIFTGETCTNIF